MTRLTVKKKEDLISILGLKVTNSILKSIRKSFMKRLPFAVHLTNSKPQFFLDDGGMLRAYAIDLATGEVLAEEYCGSADSVMMHTKEQLGQGQKAPGDIAVFFVETSPSSGNHPWLLTIVSNHITPQLSEQEA